MSYFKYHDCINCNLYQTVFSVTSTRKSRDRECKRQISRVENNSSPAPSNKDSGIFPPPALSSELSRTVITGFCNDTMLAKLEEAGCAVCGELVSTCNLSRLKVVKNMLHILAAPGVTRVERKYTTDRIHEFKGPVLDYQCDKICDWCQSSL